MSLFPQIDSLKQIFLHAGDIESMPFIEALGQFSYRVGKYLIGILKGRRIGFHTEELWFCVHCIQHSFIMFNLSQELATFAWYM